MSYASASVTTSAPRPSITERACLPEPPWDCRTVTSWPVFPFQYPANALLYSSYSSRVGSYDTLSSVTGLGAPCAAAGTAAAARALRAISKRVVFTGPLPKSSEGVLEAGGDEVLRLPVAGGGAAGEGGVLVVDHGLDGPCEIPVDAHGPCLGLAGRAGGVGEGGERRVVDAELAVARGQLDGAEGPGPGIERLLGRGAAEGVLLASEE